MTDENAAVPDAEEPAHDTPAPGEPGPESAAPPPPSEPEPTLAPPPPPPPAAPDAPPVEVLPDEGPVSDSNKVLAILGYVFVIVAVVALVIDPYRRDPFVRLNAVQAIALWVVGLTWWVPIVGWILGLVAFVVAIIAIIKVFQGQYFRIPVLYDLLKGFIEG